MLNSIFLISLRSCFLDSDRVFPPLGLLYLKSYLEMFGVKVGITDDFNEGEIDSWDAFGVSVMTPQRKESQILLETLHKLSPKSKTIVGGPHARYYTDDVRKEKWDYIVTHDGHRSLLKILGGDSNREHTDIMSKTEWMSLPRPDRSSELARNILSKYSYELQGKKATTMLTSAGCPNHCSFCAESDTLVRWSDLKKMTMEMDDIKALGYEGVYIFDDLFAISLNKTKPICEELSKRNLVFRCNAQAKLFNEDLAKMLSDHGCLEIACGIESGSQQLLNNVQKGTTIEQNYRFVELCKKYGIFCKAFLMIGLPGETYNTIQETEKFIEDSGVDDFQLSILYPYKGTEVRRQMDEGKDVDLFFEKEGLGAYVQGRKSSEAVVRTKELSSQDLIRERDRIMNKFKKEPL
jgi:anaerobic magnesium-protoporphyrin IX monomethyl ester cyclase